MSHNREKIISSLSGPHHVRTSVYLASLCPEQPEHGTTCAFDPMPRSKVRDSFKAKSSADAGVAPPYCRKLHSLIVLMCVHSCQNFELGP